MPYTYHNNPILIPRHAEVSAVFRDRDGVLGEVIQEVLDNVEPWEKGEDPIETFDLPHRIGSRVVALTAAEKPLWAINPHHKARQPGLSPFITLLPTDGRNSVDIGTLELSGTIEKPILTRVYPGDYMPPLPWMASAPKADGGRPACVDYWQSHAFVLRAANGPEMLMDTPPEWYEVPA